MEVVDPVRVHVAPAAIDYSGDPNFSVGTFDGGTNKANGFLKFDSLSEGVHESTLVLGCRFPLFLRRARRNS
ncbi:hypothetical protein ALI22I_17435 [Saccharothrix sp. ALI-22-I]|uniref:hypothetical protein n=1 Tax=Saccharothrix sp. ALI-22-I TaxID=1933778 RepID=UPI00097C7008|nr:hypothetical protein [Saccharothrix sp. ALI-22-I]ONI88772.1 hypothetical protein ALI22I_17435 [Saccharothrix sp. ALI-22-I]